MNGQGLGGAGFSGGIGQPGATGMGPGNMGGGFSGAGGFGFGAPRMAWSDPQALAALQFLGVQGGNPYQQALNFANQFAGQYGVAKRHGGELTATPDQAIRIAMMRMMQNGGQSQMPKPAPALSPVPTPSVNRLPPRPVLSPYQGQGILMRRFG